ncbi:hypothetical protein BDV93DRAFT_565975 [Ceratobasidium sp. AG-I]|nr:hypothetical protein BDV93DRAFT_565975 [Ceratobasidium sp. AG-I]
MSGGNSGTAASAKRHASNRLAAFTIAVLIPPPKRPSFASQPLAFGAISERGFGTQERVMERGFSQSERAVSQSERGFAPQERGPTERAERSFTIQDRGFAAHSDRGFITQPERDFSTQPTPGFFRTVPTAYDQPGGFTRLGGSGGGGAMARENARERERDVAREKERAREEMERRAKPEAIEIIDSDNEPDELPAPVITPVHPHPPAWTTPVSSTPASSRSTASTSPTTFRMDGALRRDTKPFSVPRGTEVQTDTETEWEVVSSPLTGDDTANEEDPGRRGLDGRAGMSGKVAVGARVGPSARRDSVHADLFRVSTATTRADPIPTRSDTTTKTTP